MRIGMSEQIEMLLQRFLDAELNRGERRDLLRLLGERPDLRQRLLDDDTMLDAAANLPRATPAADFIARTMAILPQQRSPDVPDAAAPDRRRLWRWVPAVAAASIVLLAGGFWIGREYGVSTAAGTAAAVAPAPATDVLVRLVLLEPDARSVAVAGDFNGWDPAQSPLQQVEGGVWSAMVPVSPGRYNYMFIVDGRRWLADPLAAETSVDGFGARNSVLDVEL
jgi:hypothetical protein